MGLDMYLYAKRHINASEWSSDTEKAAYAALTGAAEAAGVWLPPQYIQNMPTLEIEMPLMYWRKANHIHAWFVEHVQDGKDECQESWVNIDKLRELDRLCRDVVMAQSAEVATEKLPTTSGFFFGGTEYDKYYFEDCRETMDALTKLLADHDAGKFASWDIYYRASW